MVTVKADDRRRIQIPGIKAGQIFALENHGDGTITLRFVKPIPRTHSILAGLKPMTEAESKKAYGPNAEFDELEHHCAKVAVQPKPDFE